MDNYITVTFKNWSTYDFNEQCVEIVLAKKDKFVFFKDSNGGLLAAIPVDEIRAIIRSDHVDMTTFMKGEA